MLSLTGKLIATVWGLALTFFVNTGKLPIIHQVVGGGRRGLGNETDWLVLALVCVWIGAPWNDYLGRADWYGRLDELTPRVLIGLFGWVLLIGLTVFILVMH